MYPSTNNLPNSSYTPPPPPPPPPDSTNPNFSSFLHPIHSPYLFYEDDLHHLLHEYFLHQQEAHTTNVAHAHAHAHQEITTLTMENHIELEAAVNRGLGGLVKDDALCNNSTTGKQQIPRKRTSKKDRHSKINTAHGPRDRRMRLSLDVAQKFFGLQDMLGFDKASKTVHWLLTKSKTAIKQLTNSTKSGGNNNVSNTAASVSSTSNNSECEVLSGIINDDSSLSLPSGEVITTEKEKEKVKPAVVAREKRAATSSKASRGSRAFHPPTKETRERARARARERTVEKRIRLGNGMEGMDQSLNRHLRSWSPFEASGGEESSTQIQIVNDHPSFLRADHQSGTSLLKQGMNASGHEHSLFNAPVSWSASPYSNYHHNAAISSHENQFMEFQCFGKPWDHQAYNN